MGSWFLIAQRIRLLRDIGSLVMKFFLVSLHFNTDISLLGVSIIASKSFKPPTTGLNNVREKKSVTIMILVTQYKHVFMEFIWSIWMEMEKSWNKLDKSTYLIIIIF